MGMPELKRQPTPRAVVDEHLDALNRSDWDRLMAVETRRKVITALVANGALVGASHITAPGLGRFTGSGGRTAWEPA